jgi:aminodeoxyfutalosine deaminase
MLLKDLQNKLMEMPKAEIHVHVEGATKPETFYALAQKNNIKLPVKDLNEWKSFFEFIDFNHFIKVYIQAVSVLQKPEDYTFLIEQFYKHQAEQNIVYSEAFLSATFLIQNFNNDDILKAIEKGISEGEKNHKVKVNFIPDIARNIPDSKDQVLDLVIQGKKAGLFIGLGLGGMENGFPAELFTETYKKAIDSGLHVVAHAGEVDGPKSILSSINELNAERIGHGVRCLDDENLVKELAEKQIPMEVCPTSNYCLGVTKKGEKHQIRKMFDAGLFCTLNSDDPAMFSTSLVKEYELLASQGFSWEELWQLNLNALKASFLSDKEKLDYQNIFNQFTKLL